jgi:hypothetical protein
MRTKLLNKIEDRMLKAKSAWDRGVLATAFDLVESLESEKVDSSNLKGLLLNGAKNWKEYSYGGSMLIYDHDIAERFCSPSVLKRKQGGRLQPSSNETWLDVQARACYQAQLLIRRLLPYKKKK